MGRAVIDLTAFRLSYFETESFMPGKRVAIGTGRAWRGMKGSLASILGAAGANDDLKGWTGSHADLLQARVEQARGRALAWMHGLQAPGEPRGVSCLSAAHDASRWPGMLLPATAHAVLLQKLFGEIINLRGEDRAALVAWFEQARRPDGLFRIAGMTPETIFKKPDLDETWRYIGLQNTSLCLAAIEALDPIRHPRLELADPWLDPLILKAWLGERDLREPLIEAETIANLAALLMARQRHGSSDARQGAKTGLALILAWLDRAQEPATGFWGLGQTLGATRLLQAMTGAAGLFQLFHAARREPPFQDRAVDYALSLSPPKILSAASDAALVDILAHAAGASDYRRAAIDQWLARMLDALLDYQNQDGGFPDLRGGAWKQDAWFDGYEEKQGLSNMTASFLRWWAIALICERLWPGWKAWGFRRSPGPGFRAETAGQKPG